MSRAKHLALTRWEAWAAVREARHACDSHPATVRICWDLDNTLVNTGTLIHAGKRLQIAVIEAQPVPNMLEFYEAMRTKLPQAQHFVLTVRSRSMRRDTMVWLRRYGLTPTNGAICFVPNAEAKPRVWQQLARDARLVIVDDLSYNHESDQPSIYDDLVDVAERTASVYIGIDQIAQIAGSSGAVEAVAAGTIEALAV